jgi:hypothetical protein
VPWANNLIALQGTPAQDRPVVGTNVLNREELSVNIIYNDNRAIQINLLPTSKTNFLYRESSLPITHGPLSYSLNINSKGLI